MSIAYSILASPVGDLVLAGRGETVTAIRFPEARRAAKRGIEADWRHDPGALTALKTQLRAYFAGELRRFDLDIDPAGTPFQRQVWTALRAVPYAETRSYGAIAAAIDRPGASRAVGAANGANPIPIVVPCHRVIGANGTLTGFGGGLATKQRLLDLERGLPSLPGL